MPPPVRIRGPTSTLPGVSGPSGTVRNPYQLCKRSRAHFRHDASPMHLDGFFSDSQVVGNLLVQPALDNPRKNLALAVRESGETSFDRPEFLSFLPEPAIRFNGGADRRDQVMGLDGLGEEVHRPVLHCSHAGRNIPLPGDEYDWTVAAGVQQCLLQLKTGHVWHDNIRNDAAGTVRVVLTQEFGGGQKGSDLKSRQTQQACQRLENSGVIVDQIYGCGKAGQ